MREFFKGWRRKAGCVVLVAACVLAIAWMRSFVVEEEVAITLSGRLHACLSASGGLSWVASSGPQIPFSLEWRYGSYTPAEGRTQLTWTPGFPPNLNQFLCTDEIRLNRPSQYRPWIIHYWKIVPALTLLAAYLIFRKPRKPA